MARLASAPEAPPRCFPAPNGDVGGKCPSPTPQHQGRCPIPAVVVLLEPETITKNPQFSPSPRLSVTAALLHALPHSHRPGPSIFEFPELSKDSRKARSARGRCELSAPGHSLTTTTTDTLHQTVQTLSTWRTYVRAVPTNDPNEDGCWRSDTRCSFPERYCPPDGLFSPGCPPTHHHLPRYDDMDEPGWAWPAWKFGLKREDLFGSLHDQYNTFASTIQDPEAFHHDVYEISSIAENIDDFRRLLADRKAQRMRELNESLESAALEIIANPRLIGSEQWQYALQLFRTKSFDSLVRYFASYLPEHPGDDAITSSRGSSFAETCSVNTASTKPSTVDDLDIPCCFFTDGEDKPMLTHEPLSITSAIITTTITSQLPPSPRSMTMRSDASVSSCDDLLTHDFIINPATPARSMSFSGSESERFAPCDRRCHGDVDDDEPLETSQSDFETPATSESDMAASHSSLESLSEVEVEVEVEVTLSRLGRHEAIPDDEDDVLPAQQPYDFLDDPETETPTPRQETSSASYLDSKSLRAHRASSPKSPKLRRREGSPAVSRRSPDESHSRVQKVLPDPLRMRPKGRRRLD